MGRKIGKEKSLHALGESLQHPFFNKRPLKTIFAGKWWALVVT
jgi:hypothetical protein